MPTYPHFAQQLSYLLNQQERSGAWLARALELNPSTVNRWLRGDNRPANPALLHTICRLLQIEDDEVQSRLFRATGYDYLAPVAAHRQSVPPPVALPSPSNLIAYDSKWVGRSRALARLHARLCEDSRVLVLLGISGIGKTALAERLSISLAEGLAYRHATRQHFDSHEHQADFVGVAQRWLWEWHEPGSTALQNDSLQKNSLHKDFPQESSEGLMTKVLAYLAAHPTLLIIDSLECCLTQEKDAGYNAFSDGLWGIFFQRVLAIESFPSRIIVTSQILPTNLIQSGSLYPNRLHCEVLQGLEDDSVVALFQGSGLAKLSHRGLQLIETMAKLYAGHPLSLRTIADETVADFQSSVEAYWGRYRHEMEPIEAVVEAGIETVVEAGIETGVERGIEGGIEGGRVFGQADLWRLDRYSTALQRCVRFRFEALFLRLQEQAPAAYELLCSASVYRCPVPESWWLRHLECCNYSSATQLAALQNLRDRSLIEMSINTEHQRMIGLHNLIRSVAIEHRLRKAPHHSLHQPSVPLSANPQLRPIQAANALGGQRQ